MGPELDCQLYLGHCQGLSPYLYVAGKYRDIMLPMTVPGGSIPAR
jgi:hypothetical protein